MKGFKRYIAILASILCLTALAPAPAYAWNPFGGLDEECSGNASTSAVCGDRGKTDDPISGRNGLIMKIVNIVAFVGGGIAVIIIILAGLRFVTAGGNSEDVAGARRTLIYAFVGLVVIALARTLVAFIIGKL